MRVVRVSEVQEENDPKVSPVPGWTGGPVTRAGQVIIPVGMSKNFKCSVVNCNRGATSGFHTHSADQILIITAGIGIVATEQEEREVTVGDIVYLPGGERHWHGAKKESYMSCVSITPADSRTTR